MVSFTVYRGGYFSDTNRVGNLCSNSMVIFVACWWYVLFCLVKT
jgi:hypothetical protein